MTDAEKLAEIRLIARHCLVGPNPPPSIEAVKEILRVAGGDAYDTPETVAEKLSGLPAMLDSMRRHLG